MSAGGATRRDLADEVLPLWPDSEGTATVGSSSVMPHPDGRPWRKACGECLFRKSDPQERGEYEQETLRHALSGTHFYCLHRREFARNRVCASYAAIQRGRATNGARPSPGRRADDEAHRN